MIASAMSDATTFSSKPAFARVEPLDAHLLGLTVDRLNHATIGSDGQFVDPLPPPPP